MPRYDSKYLFGSTISVRCNDDGDDYGEGATGNRRGELLRGNERAGADHEPREKDRKRERLHRWMKARL